MLDTYYIVISFISGAFANWLLKNFWDITIKSKTTKLINSIVPIIRSKRQGVNVDEYFKIGNYTTSLFVIDGDGESTYDTGSLRAFFHDGAPDSPDDISDRILLAEREMEKAREAGNSKVWDGIGVGIRRYNILRTKNEERLGLEIHFYKSRYAAFRATVVEIGIEDRTHANSIFKTYLEGSEPREVIDFLARHVGIAAIVVTADNQMLLTQRSSSTGVRKDEYDVSIVEGIEPTKDADTSGAKTTIDVFRSVQRGCREELGFEPLIQQIAILGFAVDMSFYQYNFLSVIRTELTLAEIRETRGGRAKDAWESKIRPIRYNVDEALETINDHRMWGFATILIYWTLLSDFSRVNVDARASQIVTRRDKYRTIHK